MIPPETEDRERIAAYLRGDIGAFREVDGWVRSELRRRYAGLRSEHDDLCQAVHAKLVANLNRQRYEGRSSLRTYVTGIAHRTTIDRLRELYRLRTLSDALENEPAPGSDDPYRGIEELDEAKLIHQALLSMPPSCRELWRLAFVEKLGYAEIGRRMSIPAGTVKSRMHHCRRKAMGALRRLRWMSRSRPGPERTT